MIGVRSGLSISVLALVFMLGVLDLGGGVDLTGWVAGLVCGLALSAAADRRAVGWGVDSLGPADVVTLSRATLACGVTALVAESFVGETAGRTLVVLAAVALALDAVDGWVARRTGTAHAFGAWLDGEADAFLMLVLSVYVARSAGTWVVAMGAARYVFAVAGGCCPGCAPSFLRATGARSSPRLRGSRSCSRPQRRIGCDHVRRPRDRLRAAGRVLRARRLVAVVPPAGRDTGDPDGHRRAPPQRQRSS